MEATMVTWLVLAEDHLHASVAYEGMLNMLPQITHQERMFELRGSRGDLGIRHSQYAR